MAAAGKEGHVEAMAAAGGESVKEGYAILAEGKSTLRLGSIVARGNVEVGGGDAAVKTAFEVDEVTAYARISSVFHPPKWT